MTSDRVESSTYIVGLGVFPPTTISFRLLQLFLVRSKNWTEPTTIVQLTKMSYKAVERLQHFHRKDEPLT